MSNSPKKGRHSCQGPLRCQRFGHGGAPLCQILQKEVVTRVKFFWGAPRPVSKFRPRRGPCVKFCPPVSKCQISAGPGGPTIPESTSWIMWLVLHTDSDSSRSTRVHRTLYDKTGRSSVETREYSQYSLSIFCTTLFKTARSRRCFRAPRPNGSRVPKRWSTRARRHRRALAHASSMAAPLSVAACSPCCRRRTWRPTSRAMWPPS